MQTWFINGRHMGHAELLRWKAKQALKVEVEVVEPKEVKEEVKLPEEIKEVEVEKVEVPEVVEIKEEEIKEGEIVEETLEVEVVESPEDPEVEPKELAELETPPVIKHFCDFCDSRGGRHLKTCKLYKAIK